MDKELTELLTIQDVARLLKVHIETLRRWDKSGKLKAIKINNRGDRRYRMEDINEYLRKKNE